MGGKIQQTIFAIFAHRRVQKNVHPFLKGIWHTPADCWGYLHDTAGSPPASFALFESLGYAVMHVSKYGNMILHSVSEKNIYIESIVHSFNCQVELPNERRNRSVIYIRPPPLPFVALLLLSNAPNNSQTSSRRPQFHRKHIPSETSIYRGCFRGFLWTSQFNLHS